MQQKTKKAIKDNAIGAGIVLLIEIVAVALIAFVAGSNALLEYLEKMHYISKVTAFLCVGMLPIVIGATPVVIFAIYCHYMDKPAKATPPPLTNIFIFPIQNRKED